MKLRHLLLLIVLVPAISRAQNGHVEDWATYFETHGCNETPRYDTTVAYCRRLADYSPWVTYTTFGTSPQGRALPLVILDKDGFTSVEQVRKAGKSVVMVQACIHAGEPDGKDAGMMLLRDIAVHKKYTSLLDNVTLLFIPIMNVDGHEDFTSRNRINQNGPVEVGRRATAQRINLNRDFIKAQAPEMKCWVTLYNQWLPELFIDVHVTDGADFQYVLTYGIDNAGFSQENLMRWALDEYEKPLQKAMEKDGFPIFPYFNYVQRERPQAGFFMDPFTPQYSNGYAASQNRIGLLIETHIYKPYKLRVEGTYKMLLHSLEIVHRKSEQLQRQIALADEYTCSDAFLSHPLMLTCRSTRKDSVAVTFLAWDNITTLSDLSGAKWTRPDYQAPINVPSFLFTSYDPVVEVEVPKAYILAPENTQAIELLKLHGVELSVLKESVTLQVQTYRFTGRSSNPMQQERKEIWSRNHYEGVITVTPEFTVQKEVVTYPAGSVRVNMNQQKAKVAAFILEPQSPTSLVYWGVYNSYITPSSEFWIRLDYMEEKGREMMAKDASLKAEFEKRLAEDAQFAADPTLRLGFFMERLRKGIEPDGNLYPVGKIF